jgi:hypothetical protein
VIEQDNGDTGDGRAQMRCLEVASDLRGKGASSFMESREAPGDGRILFCGTIRQG